MGCGCKNQTMSSGGNTTMALRTNPISSSNCDFTIDQVDTWKTLLQCVSANQQLTVINLQRSLYNSFIGVLISVQNNPSTICYFSKELTTIQPYITAAISNNLCQSS